MAPSANRGSSAARRRRSYTAVACGNCQRRKIKCSGGYPCGRCRDGDLTCSYPRTTRFRTARGASHGSNRSGPSATTLGAPSRDAAASASQVNHGHNANNGPSDTQASSGRSCNSGSFAPGSVDYYIRLAESRFIAKSPEQSARSRSDSYVATGESQRLREVISTRTSDKSDGAVLKLFEMSTWTEILQTYNEEIGMQYPFLDIEGLTRRIRDARDNKCRQDQRAEDISCLVVGIVSSLSGVDMADTASPLVHSIFSAAIVRVHTDDFSQDDLGLLILTSMFFFLSDREVQAWRCMGTVMRLLHELGRVDSESQGAYDILYWTAYTLDRRWSFGTGLPFAVSDADVMYARQPLLHSAQSLSLAYLRQMVAYCGIAAEVRRALLDQPAPVQAPHNNHDAVRDFAHFRVIQWQNNLPKRLRFLGASDTYDPALEKRGEYKLRLMLYLRANQMRIIILRKSAAMATTSNLISMDEASSAHTMMEVAQDTIRVLVYLGKETDIYHAQHRTFNHFLETALSSLLLIICSAAPASGVPTCLRDVVAAMDLISQLSQQSHITKKLHEKLQFIRQVVDGLNAPSDPELGAQASQPPSAETESVVDGSTESISQNISTPVPHTRPSNGQFHLRGQGEATDPVSTSSFAGLGPYIQSITDMTMANVLPNTSANPYNLSYIPDASLSNFAEAGESMPQESYMLANLDGSRFRELNDIFMDYENFAF